MQEHWIDFMELPELPKQGVAEELLKPKYGRQNVEDYFRLLRKLAETNGVGQSNLVYSPMSLCCALRMAAMGAQGETQREIIRFTGNEDYDLNSEAVKTWSFLVYNQKQNSCVQIGVEYEDELKKRKEYNADIFSLTDQNVDELVNKINCKCSDITDGQIKNPVNETMFENVSDDEIFAAQLANVIHFQGIWKNKCYEIPEFYFCGAGGKISQVKAVEMKDFDEMQYFSSENMEAVCAPYKEGNGRYTFWGFLPDKKTELENMEFELESLNLEYVGDSVCAVIPKFKFSNEMECIPALKMGGIERAFDRSKADFSRAFIQTAQDRFYINSVFQKAIVDFNEKGTKASAINILECCDCIGFSSSTFEVYFNRPFYFMIWDRKEEVPLFVGQIYKPEY